ncbi:MAG: hypothetical protein DI569_10385 [Sphingopyxis macrogoltabida]|uniref:Uncharacterized protein n=1 Tax=Sphingopyxis macrogoltabida TaxID=33050 RepID=A0A2W5KY22_SPHMC|nr:MAG: hypothetical protein DI569_10385 [Sphingopyxis macrogoltabida]
MTKVKGHIHSTVKDKIMSMRFRRPLSITLGALATTLLGGCYYGDVYGGSYASAGNICTDRYYDYDPYAYDDGYGYDCYDGSDYGSGFVQIGFGGGWYDSYYYPGHGMWMYDNYRNRYPLRGQYLNYWGGRRAWWKHRSDRPHDGRPGRPGRPDRPGGWNGGDRDGPHGTRPGGRPPQSPATTNPIPERGAGANRPRPNVRNMPVTEPGDAYSATPRRRDGYQRPQRPQTATPQQNYRSPRGPEAARPQQRPAPAAPPPRAAQPAPVVRSAPPAAAPRPAPIGRVNRPDRMNSNERPD